MPKRFPSTRIAFPPILPWLPIPRLLSASHRPRLWHHQLNNSSCDLLLLLKPKKVEKSTGIDSIFLLLSAGLVAVFHGRLPKISLLREPSHNPTNINQGCNEMEFE
jgi:hypothetical protein